MRKEHCVVATGDALLLWGGRDPDDNSSPGCFMLSLMDKGRSRSSHACTYKALQPDFCDIHGTDADMTLEPPRAPTAPTRVSPDNDDDGVADDDADAGAGRGSMLSPLPPYEQLLAL